MENEISPLTPEQAAQLPPLVLAFLGDTLYDLMVREWLVTHSRGNVQTLHRQAVSFVKASAQAAAARTLLDELTEHEQAIFRRGRNAHSTPPKNANPGDYVQATGWETLWGYLHLTGQQQRLRQLFERVLATHEQNIIVP